jgi:hypothetical protein
MLSRHMEHRYDVANASGAPSCKASQALVALRTQEQM